MKMKHFISIDGEVYYVVKDQFGCHRCALYKSCLRNRLRLCHDFNFLCYFMKIKPMKPEDVHWEDFEFLETKVRYKGRILDKSGIATYIHETEALLGNHIWPLLSDIYKGVLVTT